MASAILCVLKNMKNVIKDGMKRSSKDSLVWFTYNEVITMLDVISEQYDKQCFEELDSNNVVLNIKLDDFLK